MKIVANLGCVTPPLTGIGQYTRQLALRLSLHEQVDSFVGLHGSETRSGVQIQRWLETLTEHSGGQRGKWRLLLRRMPGSYALRNQLQMLRFARQTRSLREHVYWEPGLALAPYAGRRVATIYDLSHLVMPETHPPSRIAFLESQIAKILTQADHLVTISETMRQDIAAHAGLAPAAISVVPPAADAAFRPLGLEARQMAVEKLGLPSQYILALGTLEPRKNLGRLLAAYEDLPTALRRQWPLVCVGGKGWNDETLMANVQRLEQRGELIRLGYVDQADLPLITAAAELLAYPSLYEGFGMPVVEAMACGVAVLTSRNTTMHEITGDNAFLVTPTDTADIRDVLQEALEDGAERHKMAKKGPGLAARYDWDSSAEVLLSALVPEERSTG